ncbi:hypothetical protein GALMADRAFT_259772, partial [Galerina marginata CBS 339.88]
IPFNHPLKAQALYSGQCVQLYCDRSSSAVACRRLPLVPSSLNVISSRTRGTILRRPSSRNLFWTGYTDQLVRTQRTTGHYLR